MSAQNQDLVKLWSDLQTEEPDSSGESDLDDCDQFLLTNAEQIIQDISPKKISNKKKVCKTNKSKESQEDEKHGNGKRSKGLNKEEVQSVCTSLKDKKVTIVLSCKTKVLEQQFWDAVGGDRELILNYTDKEEFCVLCESVFDNYLHIYQMCNKGRSQYQDFQLEWFHNMGQYLKKLTNVNKELLPILQAFSEKFKSKVVSAVHSAVSFSCSSTIIECLEPSHGNPDMKDPTASNQATCATYKLYQIHGWVLKEIICAPDKQMISMSREEKEIWITCAEHLKADKAKDKLPTELLHFDKGLGEGLIFPTPKLASFMTTAEDCFKEFSTERQFLNFGKGLIGIIKLQMESHGGIKTEFQETIKSICPEMTNEICDKFHKMWIEKYCNVRIKNFLESQEKLELIQEQKVSSRNQNLRDGLLTDHVKIKGKRI